MKKVAVCISGFVRDFEKTHQNLFDNIINNNPNYQFDIFIHTWDKINTQSSQLFIRGNIDGRNAYDNFNTYDYNKLVDIYKPKSICVDRYSDDNFKRFQKYSTAQDGLGLPGNNPIAVFSQFYKVSKCAEMVISNEHLTGEKYDVIIRTRFDLNANPINLDEFELTDDVIHLENDGSLSDWSSDKFAIMNGKVNEIYRSFYYNLESLIDQTNICLPERLMAGFFRALNIRMDKTSKIGHLKLY
jgi:hypothetical protein